VRIGRERQGVEMKLHGVVEVKLVASSLRFERAWIPVELPTDLRQKEPISTKGDTYAELVRVRPCEGHEPRIGACAR
jgi:hypothetical protein